MKNTTSKSTKKRKVSMAQSRIEIEDPMRHNGEDNNDPWRIFRIMTEFVSGFDFLKQYTKTATLFGSARFDDANESYIEAEKLATMLSKDGFAIATGGGPGIMEAANKGAHLAGGSSVGLGIKLPDEQSVNQYVKTSQEYKYFFTRKVMLVYASQVYVFFPGGYGTLDELFELLTLVKTHKIQPVPIILVNKDFWKPMTDWLEKTLLSEYHTINADETKLYDLVDSAEEAHTLIKKITNGHGNKPVQHPNKKDRPTNTRRSRKS